MKVKKIIFVVDDSDTNLMMAKRALQEDYRVMTFPSAEKMFSLLPNIKPDLILLDIVMPEIDGFAALKRLKETKEYVDIPVIFLTGLSDIETEVNGFQMGVVDFITKPFSEPVMLNRIKTHLDIDEIIRERTEQLHQKTEKLEKLQNAVIFGFADLVENRDEGTGGHIERTSTYLKVLMDKMEENSIYVDELSTLNNDLVISSARLHDVGKIAISDVILNKPGKLTDDEFTIMKNHTLAGEDAIDQIALRTDDVEFLESARLFAGSHHERWDGKGYPRGLAGTDIPLHGRLMAIVDVYDALVSERPYKKAFSEEVAVGIIMENAGTQFDPNIAEVFFKAKDKFAEIRKQIA
ncbi:MAG: response regulator [Oscillospiraceae bacterium]|jgi:putative two-component system response regulator|nr:response regulator [Oscillospiraceae bacterium]